MPKEAGPALPAVAAVAHAPVPQAAALPSTDGILLMAPVGANAPASAPVVAAEGAGEFAPRGAGDAVPISAVGVEIAARASEGKSRFEIRLDPPELGRIDVRLDVRPDGQVASRLVVERAETLDLLRRDAPALERALQSAGLQTDGSALQFSLRDQPGNGRWGGGEQQPVRPNLMIVPDDDVAVREAVRRGYGVLRGLGRGVDMSV